MIDALTFRYGLKAGLSVVDDRIVEWPYDAPEPDTSEIELLKVAYSLHLSVLEVKQKAYDIIVSRIPEWKQRNMMGAALLIDSDINKTAEQKYDELADYRTYLAWINSVRSHSDYLEGEVLAGNEVDIESGWPSWPPEGLTGSVTI